MFGDPGHIGLRLTDALPRTELLFRLHYATDGICTHEYAHLANGLVLDHIVECPKHNGRFDYRTGAAKGPPTCVNLKTYPMKVDGKTLLIKPD